jgi:predicted nucleic acid-binding protein
LKVFVDANVFFTAAYSPGGNSDRLLRFGSTRGLVLVTCDYVAVEVKRNLGRKAPPFALERLPDLLTACDRVPTVLQGEVPPGLPAKDHPIWLSALASGCEVLLTGDKRDFGRLRHKALRVLSPGALFDELFG